MPYRLRKRNGLHQSHLRYRRAEMRENIFLMIEANPYGGYELVDRILKYQRGEIEKGLLTDEEIKEAMTGHHAVRTALEIDRIVAQAQLQKILKALEENVKD
jgi:hypothetical protein